MWNAKWHRAMTSIVRMRSLFVALVLLGSAWPTRGAAFSVSLPPCSDRTAYYELMEPHDNPSSNGPKTLPRDEAARYYWRVTSAPRDLLPLGLMLGDAGLLLNPCHDKFVSLTTQGLSLREDGDTRWFLASTLRLLLHDAWRDVSPDLFASVTWLGYSSEGRSSRLGPASVGAGFRFSPLHTFVRVHLPPTFVASNSTRLGVEPGAALRFEPYSGRVVIHAGATLPWLNEEMLDGTREGLRLAPTVSVTSRTAGWHVLTGEVGARFDLRQLDQVTVGGAWRTVMFDWLAAELDAVAAVAGRRRGSFTLGLRVGAL